MCNSYDLSSLRLKSFLNPVRQMYCICRVDTVVDIQYFRNYFPGIDFLEVVDRESYSSMA